MDDPLCSHYLTNLSELNDTIQSLVCDHLSEDISKSLFF